jgi:hypothetical protein
MPNPNYAILLPRIAVASSPPSIDTDNLDGDANTDRYLLAAWVSIFTQWPGTVPADLMTLTFNIVSGASGTTPINIMSTSNSANFTFDGQNHVVNLAGTSSVNVPSVSSATQHTYVSSSTKSADETQVIVTISYNSDVATTTGLGLRIHYDNTKLELVTINNVLETELFIRPEVTSEQGIQALQALLDECYQFNEELTTQEKELFEYCALDYIEDNSPGNAISYTGTRF